MLSEVDKINYKTESTHIISYLKEKKSHIFIMAIVKIYQSVLFYISMQAKNLIMTHVNKVYIKEQQ